MKRCNHISIKNLFIAVVSGLLIGSSAQADVKDYLKDFPAGSTPEEVGLRVVGNLLGREHKLVNKYKYIRTNHSIHYSEICTVYGALGFADLTNDRDLLKGKFLWEPVKAVKKAGCDMLYIAMFDEVDEGTAVSKCTNEPPTGDGVPFLTYEGLPSDHYLWLAGQAGRLLRNEIPITRGTSPKDPTDL